MPKGSNPVLTITAAEAHALKPHIRQAHRALQGIAAMHTAARLSKHAADTRVAARRLAALYRRLDALAADP